MNERVKLKIEEIKEKVITSPYYPYQTTVLATNIPNRVKGILTAPKNYLDLLVVYDKNGEINEIKKDDNRITIHDNEIDIMFDTYKHDNYYLQLIQIINSTIYCCAIKIENNKLVLFAGQSDQVVSNPTITYKLSNIEIINEE